MAQTDIYFYSEGCDWCRKANTMIEQIGPKKFLFVNAIKPVRPLPPFVDRVPMILTHDKRVVVDDELFQYLSQKLDIAPFMIKEMSGLSDSYSYISSDAPNGGIGVEHSYDFLSASPSMIITPTRDEDCERITNYEKFVSERDNDLKHILGNETKDLSSRK